MTRELYLKGLLPRMIPCDIQCLLEVREQLREDLVLELIVAWLKEPQVIRCFVGYLPEPGYSANDLLTALRKTWRARTEFRIGWVVLSSLPALFMCCAVGMWISNKYALRA